MLIQANQKSNIGKETMGHHDKPEDQLQYS